MKRSSVVRRGELLACAAVVAAWLGCGGHEDDDPGAAPEVASEATACTMVNAGAPWWNTAFPRQSGRFHVELTATPSAEDLDAVVGLSQGAASQWTRLAAIVRFNADGFIDVRSGNEYRADTAYAYQAGLAYFIRFDVDLSTRSYSVWVKQYETGRYLRIARDYPFRTEQATVVALDNVAGFLEPDRPGALAICDLSVVQDDTTGDSCVRAAGRGDFENAQIAETTGAMAAYFTATPSTSGIDAVFGFGHGPLDDYDDYAASIRFWTNGMIEARDGDVYRADEPLSYDPGGAHVFWIIVDLPTKTYSVFVATPRSPHAFRAIARGYRFRTQQQAVAALDHGAAVVSSATGELEVCEIRNASPQRFAFARVGHYFTRPVPGGALISDGARTQRLDAAGQTIAEIPVGGMIAADARGSVYVAGASGDALTLRSFTSALTPRWSRAYAAEGALRAIGAYATGGIAVVVGDQLIEIDANGSERRRIGLASGSGNEVTIGPCGFAIAYRLDGDVVIEARGPDGSLRWRRRWPGGFDVDTMASAPSGGVVFAGTFHETVDFGDGPFVPRYIPEGGSLNTYLVVLASDGSLRFSKRFYTTYPTGVATNDSHIVIATVAHTQLFYMEIRAFDAGGAPILDWSFDSPTVWHGRTGTVAVGDGGRIYANMAPTFSASPTAPSWPFLFAFDP